ncbi:MAG: hypothetical protein JXR37_13290 [Kiritimatiellae bacterium]|nr:hypothetical protein [Kiritimatiellia bacterium]
MPDAEIAAVLLGGVLMGLWDFRRLTRRAPSLSLENIHKFVPYLWLLLLPVLLIVPPLLIAGTHPRLAWHVPLWVDGYSRLLVWGTVFAVLGYSATLAVSVAFRRLRRGRHALLLVSVVCVALLFQTQHRLYHPLYPVLESRIDDDGVIRQTSGASCAAAAAANILCAAGVHTSEREMARSLGTTRFGTSPGQIARGMRVFGVKCVKRTVRDRDILAVKAPAILLVDHLSAGVDGHAVAYIGRRAGRVEIRDPLVGRRLLTSEEVSRAWRGHAIEFGLPVGGYGLPSPVSSWIDTVCVVLLIMIAGGAGRFFSRLPNPQWLLGYALPLSVVLIIACVRRLPVLEFQPPFAWLMRGRREFVLLGAAAAMLLATPLSRLPHRRQRVLVAVFAVFFVATFSVSPYLLPALVRASLARIVTEVDASGVCLQSNGFNCGPAAAVTALRHHGVAAGEGELAILAHTTPLAGTQADSLCAALNRRYGRDGVHCEYRRFGSVSELQDTVPVIAIVKYLLLVDHYVTVLKCNADAVTIGDPLTGLRTLSHKEFAAMWRHCGIVVRRESLPGRAVLRPTLNHQPWASPVPRRRGGLLIPHFEEAFDRVALIIVAI